jgi:CPA1 family monovalent cation:H+ antiporter
LAGILTLPLYLPDGGAFPSRDLAVFLAAAVILLSLLAASIGLPRLLKGLVLPPEASQQEEEDAARHEAALAAIGAIEHLQQGGAPKLPESAISSSAAAHVIGLYKHRLRTGDTAAHGVGELRDAELAELALRLRALQAERNMIFSLARQSRISDATARKLVREIDLVEARYR